MLTLNAIFDGILSSLSSPHHLPTYGSAFQLADVLHTLLLFTDCHQLGATAAIKHLSSIPQQPQSFLQESCHPLMLRSSHSLVDHLSM
jgi:hypothetical protein